MADHNFELIEERDIAEINTKAYLYKHKPTGAEFLSLSNEDENKVFGIAFRTPVEDSTGVPHILEHSVLNGSEKYPVKMPFIELAKGTLQTFLNAFTFPDKTVYPFASQNLQDFHNLLDVYMDAVLHPLITPQILQQEGWHHEVDNPDDPLTYKGVVFNEMKGNYSNPDSMVERYIQSSLFPDNNYGHDSGGNPENIPDLTYEQFRGFWEKYYHPSNSRIFWYGDDDPEARLPRLEKYLEGYEKRSVSSSVPLHAKFDEPRQLVHQYTASEGETKNFVAVNWLLPENNVQETSLAMMILSHILVSSPSSPLRKVLIDSGYGEDVIGGGLEDQLRQMIFSTGLKGVQRDDIPKLESLVMDTLQKLVEDGIDPGQIEASLNTIEFKKREIEHKYGFLPTGLVLMVNALATWLHDGSPFPMLAFEEPLTNIKSALGKGEKYFEGLIQEHFLNNEHRTTVLLEPDPELNAKRDKAEAARLAAEKEAMNEDEIKEAIKITEELRIRQNTPNSPEALATLPLLKLEDLDKKNKMIPIEHLEAEGVPVTYHDIFTNGIVYLNVGFDLHSVPQDLLPYLSLFAGGLTRMGTKEEDFVKLSQRIGSQTGGIGGSTVTNAVWHAKDTAAWLMLRGKSTVDKTGEMLGIMKDVLTQVNFDNKDRFRQILLENKARLEGGLVQGGHLVVISRIGSQYSEAGWLSEQFGGVTQLEFLRDLQERMDSDWDGVVDKLEQIRGVLVNRSAMLCDVTVDAESWGSVRPQVNDFVQGIPQMKSASQSWNVGLGPKNEGLTIPSQVNYVGKGANFYDLGFDYHGSMSAIPKFMGTTYLWEKIREQGGAYGGFLSLDQFSGNLAFCSYRDPNLLGSVENYDNASKFLRETELSEDEVTKVIIGAIGTMDQYQKPEGKGYTSLLRHLIGYTDDFRQQVRDQILEITAKDIRDFADVLDQVKEKGSVVVLGGEEAIKKANEEKGKWLDIKKVM